MAGLHYETDRIWRGSYSDFHLLGAEVVSACAASERKFHLASRRDTKRSDWPAFQASGAKSIRQFESDYVRYSIEDATGAGHFLTIESQEIVGDIQLRATANAGMPLDLGDKICRMHKYFLRWQAHQTGQYRSEPAQ